jgi:putative DNA primase/helicase
LWHLSAVINPVREYLRGLVWDGTERIDLWLVAYIDSPETEFVKAVGARWLISAVARVFRPGCQADYTLLLEGPQGIKKSAGLRALVGDEYFADHLSPLGSKDSFCELLGKWVIELSELSAMRRSELEAVKAFQTARIDHFRAPYAKRAQDVPRQCVFAASTNDQNPFTDSSGNRRFWPVRCGAIDVEALARDRDQLWAEAFEIGRASCRERV